MGLGLRLSLWGSTVGHPSNSWASCFLRHRNYTVYTAYDCSQPCMQCMQMQADERE